MGVWGRVKAAARTLWRGPVSEATLEELYGRPVPWTDLYTVNGRLLVPALTYGPEPRKERNATLRTLQDHDRARNSSRVLAETNPNAIGLLQRLQAYNVGKGSSTEVQAVKEDAEPPKRLAAKVRDFIKQFKRANRWTQREREMVYRLHVDGEFFLRFFPQKDGVTKVRFVEPQNVRPPAGEDHEGDWSYGIHTPGGDAEEPEAYCVRDFQAGTDEIVEAQFVIHVKVNCLSNQKRGVPSLYAVEEELRGSARLRYATREGEKNRASITYFRRHKAATRDAIERAFHDPQAASALEGLGPAPDNPSTTYVEAIEPGSVVDIPDGLDPLPPPGSPNTEGGSRSVQQALEAVAARFGCPYWIASGDSGATNFAASLTAESPFTVTIQDSQADLAEVSDAAQTKALEIGAEQGLLPEDVLEQIDLMVSFPSPVSRNKKEETDRRKVLHDSNVMSETTWMTEEGLDPDKQRQQMREERADPILPLPTRVSSVPVDPRTGAPYNPPAGGGNGKAPAGTPAARYAQLAGRLREQAEALDLLSLAEAGDFDESKHPRDEGGKFGSGGGGGPAPSSAKKGGPGAREEGEEWETNGRRYRRVGGKTVRVAKEKAAKPQKAPRLTVDQAHAMIKKAGADPQALTQALLGLTVPDVKDLRKKMGLIKGSSPKQKLVDDLVAKVVAGGPESAEKPKEAPAAKEGPKQEPARTAAPDERPHEEKVPDGARPELSDEERRAVVDYTGGHYTEVNEALRGVGEPTKETRRVTKGLRAAFAKVRPFDEPVLVHRYLNFDEDSAKEAFVAMCRRSLDEGGSARMLGYSSTSTNGNKAKGEIHLNVSARKGLDCKPVSDVPTEDELLLDHGTQLRVTKIEGEGANVVVHAEQVLSEEDERWLSQRRSQTGSSSGGSGKATASPTGSSTSRPDRGRPGSEPAAPAAKGD